MFLAVESSVTAPGCKKLRPRRQDETSQAYAEAERALEMLRQEGEAEEMAAE